MTDSNELIRTITRLDTWLREVHGREATIEYTRYLGKTAYEAALLEDERSVVARDPRSAADAIALALDKWEEKYGQR